MEEGQPVSQWVKGHQASINCITECIGRPCVASSSTSVRITDLVTGRHTRGFDCWKESQQDINDIIWCDENVLAAAAGSSLSWIDQRASEDVVMRSCFREQNLLTAVNYNDVEGDEEIMCLTETSDGILASGLDNGLVIVSDWRSNSSASILRKHDNVVSGVATSSSNSIWSVGMDCKIGYSESHELVELPAVKLAGQVINPPLPTCMSISKNKSAVGVIDGTLWLFDTTQLDPIIAFKPSEGNSIEDIAWVAKEDAFWTSHKSGLLQLFDTSDTEDPTPFILTALQLPCTASAICHNHIFSQQQIITGDILGNLGIHSVPLFPEEL